MTNEETPGETASPETTSRRLIRACDRAVLSTALVGSGWPYGSLVMAACDHAARPLLLISDLAQHTKNLGADTRASLLFDGTVGMDNPLTGARVTVTGHLAPSEDSALIARYAWPLRQFGRASLVIMYLHGALIHYCGPSLSKAWLFLLALLLPFLAWHLLRLTPLRRVFL